jgi:hypothetical protein
VDSGASKHMTFNKKAFSKHQEQEASMQVELSDDATYLPTGMGSIALCMPSGDVLQLDDVLYVPSLTKNLLSMSTMTNQRLMVKFDNQQVIIRDCNENPSQLFAKGM